MKRNILRSLKWICSISLLVSCGGGGGGITIIPVTENFSQGEAFNLKLDILWVVDPSRSMYEESERVRANIASFMTDIINSGYEYRMGVVSSAAWSDLAYQADNNKSFLVDSGNKPVFNRLHKGECIDYSASTSNEPYLSYLNTLNLGSFLTNFNTYFDIYGTAINTSGCGLVGPPFGNYDSVAGNIFADPNFDTNERTQIWSYANDERPLQSMQAFLSSTEGTSFVRPDAFLAVILISDEPDGSRDDLNPSLTFDQSSGTGHLSSVYTDYLNTLKGSSAQYAVYSIIKTDGSNGLAEQVATNSGGSVINIDGSTEDYRDNLESIKNQILEDSSTYPLSVEPKPESLQVTIVKTNGQEISVPASVNGSGGFVYLPALQAIQFIPPILPGQGDSLSITMDPASLGGGGAASLPRIKINSNKISESASNGTLVGTVSVVNASNPGITYTLNSDTSAGGFALDGATGVVTVADSTKLNAESQALHSLSISASSAEIGTINSDVTVILEDVPDAIPVAAADAYQVSETAADSGGVITIIGNCSYNDTNIDLSEAHTWSLVSGTVAKGNLNFNADGSFEYTVNQSTLSLGSGSQHVENLTYKITDAAANESSTVALTLTVEGANEAPVNYAAIADQVVNIAGGIQNIPLDVASFVSSGVSSGSAGDAIDGSGATVMTTSSSGGAHYFGFTFSGSSLYEITRLEFDGDHSVGNTILQVISSEDQVLTREVLDINTGNSAVVPFSTTVIGKKINVIRPTGAVNSSSDADLQVGEIRAYGYEAATLTIDLTNHFNDPDLDPVTFFVTDSNGEGPAPGWVKIVGNDLIAVPPAGADIDIGVLAQDTSNGTAFDVFNITRTGGSTTNSAPIALLNIDDAQRGGLTLKRYGGYASTAPNTQSIQWDEADEFVDQSIDANGDPITAVYPGDFDGENHHGPGEDGWDGPPTLTTDKFAQSGRMIPLVDSQREYGEFYTGYFAPAKTGIYRFRTTAVDDVVRLLVSPSEYLEDMQRVITGTIDTANMRNIMLDSLVYADPLGLNPKNGNEFFPNSFGSGHDTSRFFLGGVLGYQAGYTYLEEGNMYAYQVRFMEGGGNVAFDFEFDYKPDDAGAWEGWRPLDAAAMVPNSGSDGYSPRVIAGASSVNFDGGALFYDAEQDVLDYSAKLVLPDGSDFVGPGSTSDVSEIGLIINPVTGTLTGDLNSTYTGASTKPRIQFMAAEKFTTEQNSTSSIPVKIDDSI